MQTTGGRIYFGHNHDSEAKHLPPDLSFFGQELPVPVQALDGDGAILAVNRAWLELMGYTAEEVTGRRLTDFMLPEHAPDFGRNFERLLSAGSMPRFEYQLRAADGSVRSLLAGSLAIRVGDGSLSHTLCLLHDITDQRLAERAQAESEDRFRQLVEHISEAFWILELDTGAVLYASPACSRVFHTPQRDFESGLAAILSKVPEEDGARLSTALDGLRDAGEPMREIVGLPLGDGEKRWLSWRAFPVRDQSGRVYRAACIGADVTERILDRRHMEALARFPAENPNPILRVLPDATVIYANPAAMRLLRAWGVERGGVLGGEYLRAVRRAFAESRLQHFEVEVHGAYFTFTAAPLIEAGYANLYGLDITRRRLAEEELGVLAQAVDQSPAMVMITDPEGLVEYVNPAFTKVAGYSQDEMLGKSPNILASGHHDREFYSNLWASLKNGETWRGEILNKGKSGRLYWQSASISPVMDDQGRMAHYVAVAEDVTEKKEAEERFRHMALHDQLTGLPNRSLLADRLDQALARIERSGGKLAVIYADLDGFKPVNDSLGHQAGDLVLQETARRLAGVLRRSDTAARMGGDEFLLVMDDVDNEEKIGQIAERIRSAVAEPYKVGEDEVRLSVSLGACLAPDHGSDRETLIRRADQAMYMAKKTRTPFAIWKPGLS